MFFKVNDLCEALRPYKKIIIYGTGNYAKEIYPRLIEQNLKEMIYCFTQTEKAECDYIDGKPVIEMCELNQDEYGDCVVLIATSQLYMDEIKKSLAEHHFYNFVFLADYEIEYLNTAELFDQITPFEGYCEIIANWCMKIHEVQSDRNEIVQKLLNRGRYADVDIDKNLIVMMCGHTSVRSNKIMWALKEKGYDIVMLDFCPAKYQWCLGELDKLNIRRYKCRCIEELLYRALEYRPLVYFFEPIWGDCSWAQIMLKNKSYFGKIVLALYDVMNAGFSRVDQKKLDTEKYALENADGIVWRGFEKEYLEKKGFRYRGKSIQFLDYCSHIDIEQEMIEFDPNRIKLCQVTGFGNGYFEKPNNTQYIDYAKLEEILGKIGNREDCIFHFYTAGLKEEHIKQCIQYERKYKNFKFFVNIKHEELLKRIVQYDFGCDLYTSGEWIPENMIIGRHTGSLWEYGIRNIFFDYLSANLPIITTSWKSFLKYLQPYDVTVKMDITNIDIGYLINNRLYYKDRVKAAREKLNINNQISSLIDFFKEV